MPLLAHVCSARCRHLALVALFRQRDDVIALLGILAVGFAACGSCLAVGFCLLSSLVMALASGCRGPASGQAGGRKPIAM